MTNSPIFWVLYVVLLLGMLYFMAIRPQKKEKQRQQEQMCIRDREGEYHGRRALMSYEVGKKALDFLIANSGSREHLEVDFFGGEPLMNWDVVKRLVEYGRSKDCLLYTSRCV